MVNWSYILLEHYSRRHPIRHSCRQDMALKPSTWQSYLSRSRLLIHSWHVRGQLSSHRQWVLVHFLDSLWHDRQCQCADASELHWTGFCCLDTARGWEGVAGLWCPIPGCQCRSGYRFHWLDWWQLYPRFSVWTVSGELSETRMVSS